MNRSIKFSFIILFIFVLFSFSITYAHPGRTDSEGGHYDSNTGEYHYHHGFPAHQHANGVCPYEGNDPLYDDNDNISNNKNSSSSGTDNDNSNNQNTSSKNSSSSGTDNDNSNNQNTSSKNSSSSGMRKNFTKRIKEFFSPLETLISDIGRLILLIILVLILYFYLPLLFLMVIELIKDFWDFFYSLFESLSDFFKNFFSDRQKKETPSVTLPVKEEIPTPPVISQEEYEFYHALYAYKDPFELCNAPPGSCLKNNLPSSANEGKYGIYTIYLSDNDIYYHHQKKCGEKYTYTANIVEAYRRYRPCPKCVHSPPPDFSWYIEYVRIVKIKQKYNIP